MRFETRWRAAALACALPFALSAGEHDHHSHAHRHDEHHQHGDHLHTVAPIAVMGDHLHEKREWMFSYRRMLMEMEGNRIGESRVPVSQVLQSFMVAPERMSMTMDMFGVMYAPREDVTWMLMIPKLDIGMDHVSRSGGRFRTESEGIGDIRLSALTRLRKQERRQLHLNLGLSIPTGDVDVYDATPMGPRTLLPYPMRLGAGTYGFMPGVTFNAVEDWGNWGLQLQLTSWLGRNSQGYQLGDSLSFQGWAMAKIRGRWYGGLRLAWSDWGNLEGVDARLNPMMVPTARTDMRGGQRLDVGLNLKWESSRGHRLGFEFLIPTHQDLDGPQLETDRTLTFGYQFAF